MSAAPDLRDALIACLAERFNRLPGQCGGHADALIAGPLAGRIAERDRLLIAFHDAIRRPLSVTPDSGFEFYDPRMAEDAETRRASRTVLRELESEEAAARAAALAHARRREGRGGDR